MSEFGEMVAEQWPCAEAAFGDQAVLTLAGVTSTVTATFEETTDELEQAKPFEERRRKALLKLAATSATSPETGKDRVSVNGLNWLITGARLVSGGALWQWDLEWIEVREMAGKGRRSK